MVEGCFKDIGKKIKKLVIIVFGLGAGLTILAGIICFVIGITENTSVLSLLGIIFAIIGPIVAWLSSFLMYAFGELVDKQCAIYELLSKAKPKEDKQAKRAENLKSKEAETLNCLLANGSITLEQYEEALEKLQ